MTEKAGVAAGGWSESAGFVDYDNDGKLDLFVTRYMEWDTKRSISCGGEWHTYCPPEEFPATTSILYHNRGDGTFEDVSPNVPVLRRRRRDADWEWPSPTTTTMGSQISSSPTTACQQFLFHNNGNGTFSESGLDDCWNSSFRRWQKTFGHGSGLSGL